jgi:hypothetical protein
LIKLKSKAREFISNIKVGQEVLTHNNELHKVTQIFRRFYTGPLYILDIKGIESHLRLTEEHPIGVIRSLKHPEITWKAACYIKPGELVLIPDGDQEPDTTLDYQRHQYGTLHPVEGIATEIVSNKPVHNIEVESVNTYIANDCAVHNCGGKY